jgi:hypothetical protein
MIIKKNDNESKAELRNLSGKKGENDSEGNSLNTSQASTLNATNESEDEESSRT